MLEIKNKHKLQEIKHAIDNPEHLDFPPFWQITIANQLITSGNRRAPGVGAIETLTRETGDNGGMLLDTTLSTRIDLPLVNAPMHCHLYLAGERITFFAGRLGKPKVHTASTDVIGQSGATYLDKTKLQQDLDFIGKPEKLIRKVVGLSRAYGHGNIKVDRLRGHLQRTDTSTADGSSSGPAWTADQATRDVLSSVGDEIKCVYRDTVKGHMGTFEAMMDPMEKELRDPVWSYDAEKQENFTHEPSDDEMPFDVVVQQPDTMDTSTSTTTTTSTTASGAQSNTKVIKGFFIRIPVKYQHIAYPPLRAYSDWTKLSNTSSSGGTTKREAKQQAKDTAKRYARQYQSFSITVPLNPLLEMYDIITISENVYRSEGLYRYKWISMINKMKDDAATMTSDLSGQSHLKDVSFTKHPPIRLSGRTLGVVPTPVPLTDVMGIDALGPWLNTDFTLNSDGVRWAGYDPDGTFWVDPDLSEGRADIEDGKLVLNIPDDNS